VQFRRRAVPAQSGESACAAIERTHRLAEETTYFILRDEEMSDGNKNDPVRCQGGEVSSGRTTTPFRGVRLVDYTVPTTGN